MLSDETRAIYEKYQETREQYDRIASQRPGGATPEHQAQARKDAYETTMHVGALRHFGGAVGEAVGNSWRQIRQGGRVLRGEGADLDALREGARSDVAAGYRNSPMFKHIRGAVDLGIGLIPGVGSVKGAGETAETLAASGASPEAQRAAAMGVAMIDALGGRLVRKGGRLVVEGLNAAGAKLFSRLPPEVPAALGLAADAAIDAGTRNVAEKVVPKIYNKDE